jgi:hypothetical protein
MDLGANLSIVTSRFKKFIGPIILYSENEVEEFESTLLTVINKFYKKNKIPKIFIYKLIFFFSHYSISSKSDSIKPSFKNNYNLQKNM